MDAVVLASECALSLRIVSGGKLQSYVSRATEALPVMHKPRSHVPR